MQAPPKTKTEGFHELTVQDAGNPWPHLQMVSIAALPISGEQMVDSLGLLLRWVSWSLVSHVPSWSHEDGPSSPHPWGPARDLHYPWVGETDKRKFCYGPNCRMNKFNVFLGQTSHCFHQKLWIVSQIFELGKVYLQICMDIPQPFSDVWVRNRHARRWLSTQASAGRATGWIFKRWWTVDFDLTHPLHTNVETFSKPNVKFRETTIIGGVHRCSPLVVQTFERPCCVLYIMPS